jgi:hypothetical protein
MDSGRLAHAVAEMAAAMISAERSKVRLLENDVEEAD